MSGHGTDRDTGFTIVELMVVVLMLGILLAVAVSSYMLSTDRAYRISCLADQRAFATALEQYRVGHHGAYPASLDALRSEGLISPRDEPRCPRDPSAGFTYAPETGTIGCPLHPYSP